MTLQGGCLCGKTRYTASGTPFSPTACHCIDCRRATGTPIVAWFSLRPDELHFTSEPRRYTSSPGVTRSFCPDCGTPLTYQVKPDEIDVTTCSLDDPGAIPPGDHVFTATRVPWIKLDDGLPQYPRRRIDGVAPTPHSPHLRSRNRSAVPSSP